MLTIHQYSHNDYELTRGEFLLKKFYQQQNLQINVINLYKMIDVFEKSHEIDCLFVYEDVWQEALPLVSQYSQGKNHGEIIVVQVKGSLQSEFLEKAQKYILPKGRELILQGKYTKLELTSEVIHYLEKNQRKVYIQTTEEKYELLEDYQKLSEKLKAVGFLSPYMNILVNPQWIRTVKGRIVTLLTGEELPLSQKKAASFRQKLKEN
ncbi:LytTR family DNA-binding domain-containing protein [Vagococcus salmoninarum]|uniref:LytTR family DNA-binding domain-containing protein n=1 Tax=Vagococcus salmoninarum TaxID=2739 RepID=UPI003F9E11D5